MSSTDITSRSTPSGNGSPHPNGTPIAEPLTLNDEALPGRSQTSTGQELPPELRHRSFSFDRLPAWMREDCTGLARREFHSVGSGRVVDLVFDAFAREIRRRHGNKLLQAVLKHTYSPSPDKIIRALHKGREKAVRKAAFSNEFDAKAFQQLGVEAAGSIGDLLDRSRPSQLRRPEARGFDIRDMAEYAQGRAERENSNATPDTTGNRSMSALRTLLAFDPSLDTDLGAAARTACAAIAYKVAAFTLIEDLCEEHSIELSVSNSRKLVREIEHSPAEALKSSDRIRRLVEFAKVLQESDEPLSHITPFEAFNSYAMQGRDWSDVIRDDTRRRAVPYLAPTNQFSPHEQGGENREERARRALNEVLLESPDNEAMDAAVQRGIINLCLRRSLGAEELRTLMTSNDWNPSTVLDAIRRIGDRKRPKKEEPGAHEMPQPAAPVEGPTASHITYDVHLHTEDLRHGVPAYLDRLDRTAAEKVEEQIKDAAEGKRGCVRRISQRGFSEGDISVHEIKSDHHRIYFRYVPGRRMILLTAGDKDSQETDVQRAFLMAAKYRGMKEGDPCPLPYFEPAPRQR